ncbi:hypothetical protein G6F56_000412 [Rhizopus delemar]|nr:hypothetical protein G6F56_000412 [Rhizopus delemar]
MPEKSDKQESFKKTENMHDSVDSNNEMTIDPYGLDLTLEESTLENLGKEIQGLSLTNHGPALVRFMPYCT